MLMSVLDPKVLGEELGAWLTLRFGTSQVYLATWTFAPTPWAEVPGLQYVNKAREALAKRLDGLDSSAFVSTERGRQGSERLHLHSINDSEDTLLLASSWWRSRYGFTKLSPPVDSKTGAAMYVAKYVTKSTGALVAPMFSAVGPRFPVVNAVP